MACMSPADMELSGQINWGETAPGIFCGDWLMGSTTQNPTCSYSSCSLRNSKHTVWRRFPDFSVRLLLQDGVP
jgi:hypothetical protein